MTQIHDPKNGHRLTIDGNGSRSPSGATIDEIGRVSGSQSPNRCKASFLLNNQKKNTNVIVVKSGKNTTSSSLRRQCLQSPVVMSFDETQPEIETGKTSSVSFRLIKNGNIIVNKNICSVNNNKGDVSSDKMTDMKKKNVTPSTTTSNVPTPLSTPPAVLPNISSSFVTEASISSFNMKTQSSDTVGNVPEIELVRVAGEHSPET